MFAGRIQFTPGLRIEAVEEGHPMGLLPSTWERCTTWSITGRLLGYRL
jgi:hypothetical protein